jgi:hypothetical protein
LPAKTERRDGALTSRAAAAAAALRLADLILAATREDSEAMEGSLGLLFFLTGW